MMLGGFLYEKWTVASSDWLVFDESNQSMFCSTCWQHAPSSGEANSFVEGTNNLNLEAVKDHESSKCHKEVKCVLQGIVTLKKTAARGAVNSLKTA